MAPTALEAIILRDNRLAREGLREGHGFAMLLRVDGATVIFDTGDSEQTWANADRMGIDLSDAGCVALSHGHYDHTNGLPALLQRTGAMTIIAHPAVFEPRYADRESGEHEYIGPPATREEFEAMGGTVKLSAGPVELAPGLITTGEVPRVADLAPVSPHLLVEREGQVVQDDFVDDLSLVAQMDEGDVLLTGCAHAGLVNIVARATKLTGRCPVSVAGGTHLARESEDRIALVAADVFQRGVRQIVPMHCSGERGAHLLEKHFAGEVLRAGVGSTIVADAAGHIVVH